MTMHEEIEWSTLSDWIYQSNEQQEKTKQLATLSDVNEMQKKICKSNQNAKTAAAD